MNRRAFWAIAIAACTSGHPPAPAPSTCDALALEHAADPLDHGRQTIAAALNGTPACVRVALVTDAKAAEVLSASGVALGSGPEAFAVVDQAGTTWVIGSDAAGAMYGAFELAERLELDGAAVLPLKSPLSGSPAVPLRGANLFLTLPAAGETAWWFDDDDFWAEYLNLLAKARMNVLDLHGMYNADNTLFPNALPYFSRATTHPEIGVSGEQLTRNLDRLKKIVAGAAERGIKVALMTYQTDLSLLGGAPDWNVDDAANQQYTREAVAELAREVPQLWRLGFRIGESTHPAVWYRDSFVAGLHDSQTAVRPYTRSWWVPKADMLSLIGDGADDYLVEAKFNGEQLGSPYPIAGGYVATAGWTSYSYEDYLDPPAPYRFVFQLRTAGTHRMFRNTSVAQARRTVGSLAMKGVEGYSFEAPHAYLPVRDFYHRAGDAFSSWTFRRDELLYLLYGRLAYEPGTDERVFRHAVEKRAGTDALWLSMQAASEVVPWVQQAHTCGFDERQFAADLELGGTAVQWAAAPGPQPSCARAGPFDPFAIASPFELATDLASGQATARLTPLEISRHVLEAAGTARLASTVTVDPLNAEARDLQRECVALADLGDFFGHKLRAATAIAVHQQTAAPEYLAAARAESAASNAAFTQLAADTAYIAAFDERMRMAELGLSPFHWANEVPLLSAEATAIDTMAAAVAAQPPNWQGTLPPPAMLFDATRPTAPAVVSFEVTPSDGAALTRQVAVTLGDLPAGATVRLWWKRFANVTDFAAVPMSSDGGARFEATVNEDGPGGLFAIEVTSDAGVFRLPDVLTQTPYWTVNR